MLTRNETPSLEAIMQTANHRERVQALNELTQGISRILEPRGGRTFYAGSDGKHFLPIPPAPEVPILRNGMPGKPTKEQALAFQEELTRITLRERELTDAAQTAKNVSEELSAWLRDLGPREDRLLVSTLTEDDRPDVEALQREHARFVRTCRQWTAKLDF